MRQSHATGHRGHRVSAILAYAAAAVGLLAAAGLVRAEQIVTRGGTTFTGQIIKDDGGKIVVKTVSGTITVARDDIERIDKDAPDAPDTVPEVVPIEVKPEKAPEALAQARAAMNAGEWLKAGGLLEGLGRLEPNAMSLEDRQAAAAGLATCYLQIGDGGGASRAFTRRATVEADEGKKRQLLAAAEAFRTVKGIRIGDQEIRAYGEALPAAVRWKGEQLVEEAKGLVAGGRMYAVPQRLLRTAQAAVAKLEEADQYTPGAGSGRRHEILKALADDLLDGVRKAITFCTEARQGLDRDRWQSLSNKEVVKAWAGRIMHYVTIRDQADSALENLQTMAEKMGDRGLYDAKTYDGLRAQLEDLKFYPRGAGTRNRVRIKPYRTAP